MNQGAFQFGKAHIDGMMRNNKRSERVQFIGRNSLHSFAAGASVDHKKENESLWKQFNQSIVGE